MSHDRIIDWTSVDWSLSTKEICRLTGRVQATVCQARRKYAPHTLRKNSPRLRWDLMDWSKSNKDIHAETRASMTSICNARRKWATPKSKTIAVTATHVEVRQWADAAKLEGFGSVSEWLIAVANRNA